MTTSPFLAVPRPAERGGITILVVLSLLVLITAAAVGMSRNSMRELMIVGSSRQAANVRQAADAGLDFAVLWINPQNNTTGVSSLEFQKQADSLAQNTENQGIYFPVSGGAPTTETTLQNTPDYRQAFSVSLLRVDQLDIPLSSDPRAKPDLWVVHSAGTVAAGSTSFQHDKEMWVTTAVRERKF